MNYEYPTSGSREIANYFQPIAAEKSKYNVCDYKSVLCHTISLHGWSIMSNTQQTVRGKFCICEKSEEKPVCVDMRRKMCVCVWGGGGGGGCFHSMPSPGSSLHGPYYAQV